MLFNLDIPFCKSWLGSSSERTDKWRHVELGDQKLKLTTRKGIRQYKLQILTTNCQHLAKWNSISVLRVNSQLTDNLTLTISNTIHVRARRDLWELSLEEKQDNFDQYCINVYLQCSLPKMFPHKFAHKMGSTHLPGVSCEQLRSPVVQMSLLPPPCYCLAQFLENIKDKTSR